MAQIMEWISANWVIVALVVGVVIQILQAATKHFSEHQGFVKIALFAVEMLSIFRSASIKPPLASKPPKVAP